MGDWQPIATAPKDGTPILASVAGHEDIGAVQVARVKPQWSGWHSIPGDYHFRPTHWMPLPPTPQTKETGEP